MIVILGPSDEEFEWESHSQGYRPLTFFNSTRRKHNCIRSSRFGAPHFQRTDGDTPFQQLLISECAFVAFLCSLIFVSEHYEKRGNNV